MGFPCPNKIDCGVEGILGVDLPYANLSAEGPDLDLFIEDFYGYTWWRPNLGSIFSRSHCLGTATSTISQADANLQAVLAELQCIITTWGVDPTNSNDGVGGGGGGRPVPGTIYFNTPVTSFFRCADGSPFYYSVGAGVFSAPSLGFANAQAYALAVNRARENYVCLSDLSTSTGCVGQVFGTLFFASTPSTRPITFVVVDGSIPPGTTLGSTGSFAAIGGTPLAAGEYTFTIRATDSFGNWMQKQYTINIVGIDQDTLPDGDQNSLYNQFVTSSGGVAPYTYSIVGGALPAGINLLSTGALFGTPEVSGDFTFTIQVSTDIP